MSTDTDADYIRMVKEIQRGDNVNENLALLCERFRGVVIAAAQKSGRRQEAADIVNDAPMFIYKAALSYDPNRGSGFAGFLTRKVGWFIGHEWQKSHDRISKVGKKVKWIPRVFERLELHDILDETTLPREFDHEAFNRALGNLSSKDSKLIKPILTKGCAVSSRKRSGGQNFHIYRHIEGILPVLATLYKIEIGHIETHRLGIGEGFFVPLPNYKTTPERTSRAVTICGRHFNTRIRKENGVLGVRMWRAA